MHQGQSMATERPPLIPKSEEEIEREALAWLEAKEAALRRKKSGFIPKNHLREYRTGVGRT